MITAVDQGLERFLRAAVPLPQELADISFDPPDGTWGAQLSRITVSLFLFDVARSAQPPRPPASRSNEEGKLEVRAPLPLIQLHYMVSAWAGSVADEHQVLGDVLTCLLGYDAVPQEHLPPGLASTAQLSIGQREGRKPGELWGGLQGKLKPSFEIEVTVAADAAWKLAPPAVTRIEGAVRSREDEQVTPLSSRSAYSARSANPEPSKTIRHRSGSAVVAEGRPAEEPA